VDKVLADNAGHLAHTISVRLVSDLFDQRGDELSLYGRRDGV